MRLASPFTTKEGLVHFALPTYSSHPMGTVERQLSVKASSLLVVHVTATVCDV